MPRSTLSLIAAATLLFAATPALAKKRPPKLPAPVRDCATDGDLDRVYSPGELTRALRNLPSDVATYTNCRDVLRFARAAGPVVPVHKRTARLRSLCTGAAYPVSILVNGTTLGSATVPACRANRTKIVRVPVGRTGQRKARRHSRATIVAKPGGKTIQFVVRLTGRK